MWLLKRRTPFFLAPNSILGFVGFINNPQSPIPILYLHTAWEAMTYRITKYNRPI